MVLMTCYLSEVVYALLKNAGSAGRWDARPGRLHLRHQELQVQGGGDQAHQQGKEHHHHLYRWRDQQLDGFRLFSNSCLILKQEEVKFKLLIIEKIYFF